MSGSASQIGPYTIHGAVGEGAFSVVRLAQRGTQLYACKIVPRQKLDSDSLLDRFKIEISIFQQMRHPGIVQLVDLFSDSNNFYVFMEYCPNGELFQYIIDRGRLSETDAKPIIREMLDTLQYVHSHGVSHRDLKPENLLIDKDGNVKLSDFGLSRYIGNNNLVETPCGSPCYASPECLSGKPYDGFTTDIWSLGVIIYAMLTGQLPWTKRNQAQLFAQIKRGEYSLPSFLSPEAQGFISGLMTVDIHQRLTIQQAIDHPFLRDIDLITPSLPVNMHYVTLKAVDRLFDTDASVVLEDIENIANSYELPNTARAGNFVDVIKQLKDSQASHESSALPALKYNPNTSAKPSLSQNLQVKHQQHKQRPPSVKKIGRDSRQRTSIPSSTIVGKPTRPIVQKPNVKHNVPIY